MPKELIVHKRVKRHVIGRKHLFFAVAPPALSGLAKCELESLLAPENALQSRPGGLEFSGRLEDAYRVNLQSRFSNRVLMQLASFKAIHFWQLEKKISELPWELFLYNQSDIKIRVNSRKCRLYHSSAVAERVEKHVRRHLEQSGLTPDIGQRFDEVQQIFIRGTNDRFSISIDSSGEHLYKRGLKTHGGRAPLRENLAAAVLQLAGYDGREPLVDPMCGSGTFSLEAASRSMNIPPGWFREFAFMQWPSFIPRRWDYLRKQHENGLNQQNHGRILAADSDKGACDRLRQCIRNNGLESAIDVIEQDFFQLRPGEWTDQKGVVVINPPYGRRIVNESANKMLTQIIDRLKLVFGGWRVGLIAPRRQLASIKSIPLETYPLIHGGLRVAAGVGMIP